MHRFRTLPELCAAIRENRHAVAREVVDAWDRIGVEEPWLRLPDDLDHDHLPDLIDALAEVALCTFFHPGAFERKLGLAIRHGEDRRSDGFDEPLLFREYHLLRRGLWRHIRRNCDDASRGAEAILRIDAVITHATAASLRGFHRNELEAMGTWDDVIERLKGELPVNGLRPKT